MTLRNESAKTNYPAITLAEARKAHRDAQDKLDNGLDPAANAIVEREVERKAPTVADLAVEYLEKWAKPCMRSWREDNRILEKDVLPEWGQRKARNITRRDTIRPNRRRFGAGCAHNGQPHPCCNPQDVQLRCEPGYCGHQTTDEILALWHGLEGAKMMAEGTKLALKLQLLTGQRKAEIVMADWWTMSPEKAKNKMAHRVPLSPPIPGTTPSRTGFPTLIFSIKRPIVHNASTLAAKMFPGLNYPGKIIVVFKVTGVNQRQIWLNL